jgi:predicted Zn-dependent peptidase
MKASRTLILLFAMSSIVFAEPKETPPASPPPKPFHLPPTTDFTLPNGMRVTIVPYGIVPKVAIRAFVDAGAIDEPAGHVWLAKLHASLMKEGTRTRSGEQIAREAAEMGGQLEIDSGSDYTSAGGVVLSDFAPQFITLLADVLAHPSFPVADLPRLKADLVRQLAIDRTEPGALARERFLKTLFPDHPYGRGFPSEADLKSYTIDDVQAFYRNNFAASRTRLYIAGKLEGDLRKAAEDAFSGWAKGNPASAMPPHAVKARSLQLIDRPGAEQTNLILGLPVVEPTNQDYITLEVMNSLLGGSFASRITSNIREQKGYTYSPQSRIETRQHFAFWLQSADVTTAVTGPSLKEIFYEVDRLRKDPPSAKELEGIQNYLAGLFVLRNTISPDDIITQLHFVDLQGLDRSYLSTYVQKVMAVKPQDVQRVAESYIIPSKMTIVAVGDKAKIGEQIKPYE